MVEDYSFLPIPNKVLLYGTGSSARYFLEQHGSSCEVIAVTDGVVSADNFLEIPCVSIEEISMLDFDAVVVASWAITDIASRLEQVGTQRENILWFQHNKNRLVPCDHPDALSAHRELAQSQVLYAFYDLNVARATFDILGFLCLAEQQRQLQGCDSLHIVVVSASNNDFNVAARGIISTKEHVWRKRQILAQSCGLLAHCSGFTFTSTREEAQQLFEHASYVFPADYQVDQPIACWEFDNLFKASKSKNDISCLKASDHALNIAQQFINHLNSQQNGKLRKVVCITLRESQIKPARNSNYQAWQEFIEQLDKNTYFPLILPDTDNSWSPKLNQLLAETGAPVFTEACFNVELRMAIYELSYINLGVNNGPMHLCALSRDCRYIMYKQVTEDYAHTSTQSFIDRGFTIGGHFAGANEFQRLIWQDDDFEVIWQSFKQLVQDIEQEK